jgi:hypothetical protein
LKQFSITVTESLGDLIAIAKPEYTTTSEFLEDLLWKHQLLKTLAKANGIVRTNRPGAHRPKKLADQE